ncbi:hypothetical protein AVEN_104728-1, partial [Araneus ventricosus]
QPIFLEQLSSFEQRSDDGGNTWASKSYPNFHAASARERFVLDRQDSNIAQATREADELP